MRNLSHLAFAFMLGIFSLSTAHSQMLAGYDQFCGVPVWVTQTPLLAVASRDPNGRPIIYVDPAVMNNWSHSRIFALAHECGHHRLGHTTPIGMWWRDKTSWATRIQELEADCWAAIALRRLWQVDDIERVIRIYVAEGNVSTGGYPSGSERARNILGCAATAYPNLQSRTSSLIPSPNPSVAETIKDQPRTPFSYIPTDWDTDTSKEVDTSADSLRMVRFVRYLEIIKWEIPRFFMLDKDDATIKFEKKGTCIARFEFKQKNNILFVADLDFRDDLKFEIQAPLIREVRIRLETGHWDPVTRIMDRKPTGGNLLRVNADGSTSDLDSFPMIAYVKQEEAERLVGVMKELVKICQGPPMYSTTSNTRETAQAHLHPVTLQPCVTQGDGPEVGGRGWQLIWFANVCARSFTVHFTDGRGQRHTSGILPGSMGAPQKKHFGCERANNECDRFSWSYQ